MMAVSWKNTRALLLAIVLSLGGLGSGHEGGSRPADPGPHRHASAEVAAAEAAGAPAADPLPSTRGAAPLYPSPQQPGASEMDKGLPPVGAPGALSLDPARAALVEQARADLARRESVAPDAVTLIEIRGILWPDGGLGCPRPGVRYPQVPVDGFLIRLGLGGRVFNYHQGRGRPPFLCERSG